MTDIYDFLNEEEKKMLDSLNLHILAIKNRQLVLVREAAKREGVIAQNLEALESQKGEPFREEKSAGPLWGDYSYQKAFAGSGRKMEEAYLCKEMRSKEEDADGCGWVKGAPIKKGYDEIGILSGSRGTRCYCRICLILIGEHETISS